MEGKCYYLLIEPKLILLNLFFLVCIMAASKKQKNKLILIVDAVISVILVAVILYWVGFEDVLQTLASIDLVYLFLSIVFLLAMYIGMIARIRILLTAMKQAGRWLDITRAHFVGMLLADFTPARTGYFGSVAVLHHRFKLPSEKALLSVFGPQIFDFALKLIIGTLGVYYLLIYFLQTEDSFLLFLGSLAMTVIIITMLLLLFSQRFLKLFSFAAVWPVVSIFYKLIEKMQTHSHVVIKKTPEILILLLYTWSMKAISWFFVAKALGITINIEPFPELAFYYFFQPLITMLEFMPSPTLAGIGLSEGGSTLVMALFGVSPAAAATFALVARFKTTLVNLVAVPDTINLLHSVDFSKLLKP